MRWNGQGDAALLQFDNDKWGDRLFPVGQGGGIQQEITNVFFHCVGAHGKGRQLPSGVRSINGAVSPEGEDACERNWRDGVSGRAAELE
jgi:hypothetical protein